MLLLLLLMMMMKMMTMMMMMMMMMMTQVEMRSQKDELQRQRDALQRQIDLFEQQRRQHWQITGTTDRQPPGLAATRETKRPDHRPTKQRPITGTTDRQPPGPAATRENQRPDHGPTKQQRPITGTTDRQPPGPGPDPPGRSLSPSELARALDAESGAPRHLSPVGGRDAAPHDARGLSRVSSVGNVAALDGGGRMTVTRFASAGSLHSGRSGPLADDGEGTGLNESTTLRSSPSSVQQIIPTKLSTSTRDPTAARKTSAAALGAPTTPPRDHGGGRRTSLGHGSPTPATPCTGAAVKSRHVGSRDSPGNVLPMKLAEDQRSRSSTSNSAYVTQRAPVAAAAAALGANDGGGRESNKDEDIFKTDDKDEPNVLYF